ncbi:hypothetical protein BV898_16348 [Hypsibius exemplaris]|uniref:RING-type domain-containing protein n=1 Tax=Hypsibius exemplaris TaxID=2072580 RepID=A0A9X6ND95_HYPEX|nr:hypothetical protein BV898_16348 [Hypsibius exemplaris]
MSNNLGRFLANIIREQQGQPTVSELSTLSGSLIIENDAAPAPAADIDHLVSEAVDNGRLLESLKSDYQARHQGQQRHIIRLRQSDPEVPVPTLTSVERNQRDHGGVFCDGCKDTFKGTRYKCIECPDYDLCRSCEVKDVHSQHSLIAIRVPELSVDILMEPDVKTEDDYDYIFDALVLRESPDLWMAVLKGSSLKLTTEVTRRLLTESVPSILLSATPTALFGLLVALKSTSNALTVLNAWTKDPKLHDHIKKRLLIEEYHVYALVRQETAAFAPNYDRANRMYAKLIDVLTDYDINGNGYLEATAALLAYRYLKVAGVIAENLCRRNGAPDDLSRSLLARMAFYQPTGSDAIDTPENTTHNDVWRVLGDGCLGASRLSEAMELHIRARYAGSYAEILSELQNQPSFGAWSTAADYLKMVKQSVNDTNVTVALTAALAKAQRFGEIQNHLMAPVSTDRLCVVCLVNMKTVAFNPCGHLCVCTDCADHGFQTCPVCRENVTNAIKIFT